MRSRIVRTKALMPAMALLGGIVAGTAVSGGQDIGASMRERIEVAYRMLEITQGRGVETANWQSAMSGRCIDGDNASCRALRAYAARRSEMLTGILMDEAEGAVAPAAGP